MSLSSKFKTNADKEVSGVTIDFGVNDDGSVIQFILARSGGANAAYDKAVERETRPYKYQIQKGLLDNKIAKKIFTKVFVETVAKGWNNVPLSDVTGDPKSVGYADFTKENATMLFERLPDLYAELQLKANELGTFQDDEIEQDAKN